VLSKSPIVNKDSLATSSVSPLQHTLSKKNHPNDAHISFTSPNSSRNHAGPQAIGRNDYSVTSPARQSGYATIFDAKKIFDARKASSMIHSRQQSKEADANIKSIDHMPERSLDINRQI